MDWDVPVNIVLLIIHYLRNQNAKRVRDGEVGNYFDIVVKVR